MKKQPGDSHFWTGLMDVKDLFLEKGKFKVNSENQTRFWEDLWIGQEPSSLQFPGLYRIARRKNVSVANVLGTTPLNMAFRRALLWEKLLDWFRLVALVLSIKLNEN